MQYDDMHNNPELYEHNTGRLSTSMHMFEEVHEELLVGSAVHIPTCRIAESPGGMINATQDVCIIQQMKIVWDEFVELEETVAIIIDHSGTVIYSDTKVALALNDHPNTICLAAMENCYRHMFVWQGCAYLGRGIFRRLGWSDVRGWIPPPSYHQPFGCASVGVPAVDGAAAAHRALRPLFILQ